MKTYFSNPYNTEEILADGGLKVLNRMTGLSYKFGSAAANIYRYIKEHNLCSTDEVVRQFEECSKEEIESIFHYFHSKRLILTEDATDLACITKKDTPLFGLSDYLKKGNLAFLGIPFGAGNPLPNSCANFPDYLRVQLRSQHLNFKQSFFQSNSISQAHFDYQEDSNLNQLAQQYICDLGNIFLHFSESKALIYERIELLSRQLANQSIPFFIGGDHSITYSLVKGIASIHSPLCLVQLDAHSDTYRSNYDRLTHLSSSHHHGNFVNRCVELEGVNRVLQLGLRGQSNYSLGRIHPKQRLIVCRALKAMIQRDRLHFDIPNEGKIYITIDIDVLDPSIAPATTTPEKEGLNLEELLIILRHFMDHYGDRIVGFDLVEVSAHLDSVDKATTKSVTEVLIQIIQRFCSQKDKQDGTAVSTLQELSARQEG